MPKVMYVESQPGAELSSEQLRSLEVFLAQNAPELRFVFLPPGCTVTEGRPRGYTYRTEIGHTAEELTFATRQEMLDYVRGIRTKP